MALLGMNVEDGQTLAKSMSTNADQINQAGIALTTQLTSLDWRGTDGDTFRNDWETTYKPQLNNIVQQLHDHSTRMSQEVAGQIQASGGTATA